MRVIFKPISLIFLVYLMVACSNVPSRTAAGLFSAGNLDAWKEHVFAKPTKYTLVQDGGVYVLQALSNKSASALYQKVSIDLNVTPYINWRWKVDHAFAGLNEHIKSGDDYPVRVYVVLAPKPFRFKPRSLNYVWSNNIAIGEHWFSPYSNDVVMVSLQSGNDQAGQWLNQKRNLKSDLKLYLGEEIRYIEGIAIMTDTDDSQNQATSYYGDVYFTAE